MSFTTVVVVIGVGWTPSSTWVGMVFKTIYLYIVIVIVLGVDGPLEWVDKWPALFLASMIRARGSPVLFSPPASPPSLLSSSSLQASSGACESGLPVLGWMQPRISLNPPALNSQSHCTDSHSSLQPPPLLPLPHPLSRLPPAVWAAEELQMLFIVHTSLYCVVLTGSHRLHLSSCSWDVQVCAPGTHSTLVWAQPHKPYCLLSLQVEI